MIAFEMILHGVAVISVDAAGGNGMRDQWACVTKRGRPETRDSEAGRQCRPDAPEPSTFDLG
jgi:hypothetical protein